MDRESARFQFEDMSKRLDIEHTFLPIFQSQIIQIVFLFKLLHKYFLCSILSG